MPIDPVTGGLVKFVLDQIGKRLPDASSKTRVGDLLAVVMAQRDRLQIEASRQAIRIAELEARLARLELE